MTLKHNHPLEEAACDLCGADDAEPRMEKDGYRIVGCRRCGLVYVSPRIATEALAKSVYGQEYFTAEAGYGLEDHFDSGARDAEKRMPPMLDRLEKETGGKRGRLLDIGCAGGYFIDAARKRGWDASGMEISSYAAERASKERGIDVIVGDVSRDAPPESTYDAVTMFDVIEHLSSPTAGLENVYRALKPGGVVYIATPNFEGTPSKRLGVLWGLISPEHHFYYFTPKTLGDTLKKTGFAPLRWEYPRLGLTDLFLSVGAMRSLGVNVGEREKIFVRNRLRGARAFLRETVDAIDAAVIAPLFARERGNVIEVIARRADSK